MTIQLPALPGGGFRNLIMGPVSKKRASATGIGLTEPDYAGGERDRSTGRELVSLSEPRFDELAIDLLDDVGSGSDAAMDEATRILPILVSCQRLVDSLEDLVGLPELDVDPDGDVGLDWYMHGGIRLAVSVNETGRVAFVLVAREQDPVKGSVSSISRAGVVLRSALMSLGR